MDTPMMSKKIHAPEILRHPIQPPPYPKLLGHNDIETTRQY
jgi:hypothetical protein